MGILAPAGMLRGNCRRVRLVRECPVRKNWLLHAVSFMFVLVVVESACTSIFQNSCHCTRYQCIGGWKGILTSRLVVPSVWLAWHPFSGCHPLFHQAGCVHSTQKANGNVKTISQLASRHSLGPGSSPREPSRQPRRIWSAPQGLRVCSPVGGNRRDHGEDL